MISAENILNKKISYQADTWSTPSKELTIYEALTEIKSNKYKQHILNLRSLLQNGKREEYNSHKRTLPAVTFCGIFDGERKKNKIKKYNSLMVLDIDKLCVNDLNKIKTFFRSDSRILAFWESPSQEGIKGLVSLKYNFELNSENIDRSHKVAFQKLSVYFNNKYNIKLDVSGSDITRLCFFSYDPFLDIKNRILPFEINETDIILIPAQHEKSIPTIVHPGVKIDLYNPLNKNRPVDRYTINAIIKYLEKRKLSITYSYDEWYKVGMAITNTFTYEIGEKYFLKLSSLDIEKYNESNCKKFLLHCYESKRGLIKFNTIIFLANKKGYIIKRQKDGGSEVLDENLSQVSSSNTVYHLPEDLKK